MLHGLADFRKWQKKTNLFFIITQYLGILYLPSLFVVQNFKSLFVNCSCMCDTINLSRSLYVDIEHLQKAIREIQGDSK